MSESGAHFPGMLLSPKGIGISDQPPQLFRYGLPHHDELVRTIVPFIETLASDDEAFEARFTDEQRLETCRTVYGKDMGLAAKRKRERAESAGLR